MSEKLEDIQKTLGMLLENSNHTKETLERLNTKVENHVGEEGKIFAHVGKKMQHSENRLRIITDGIKKDVKERCDNVENNCAPLYIEKQMNAIWTLIGILLIGSIGFIATQTLTKAAKENKQNPSIEAIPPKRLINDTLLLNLR